MTQTTEQSAPAAEPARRRGGDTRSRGRARGRTAAAGNAPQPAPKQQAKPRSRDDLVLGGAPRAHLLPPEVQAERQAAALRRRLGFGVLAVIAVVALAIIGASAAGTTAQARLASEQSTTQALLAQELTYVKVQKVQGQVDLVKTAQEVGASTEIDWKSYLQKVQATLPGDVTIATVNVDSSTPIALYQQATASLQGPRVATVVFTAKSPSLPVVPQWLDALETLPGYADALPDSVARDNASGTYTVTITMHIDSDAFSHRFQQKKKGE